MIGRLLGHTQVQTTARYAHLARDSIQNARRPHNRQHRPRPAGRRGRIEGAYPERLAPTGEKP